MTTQNTEKLELHDFHPSRADQRSDVLDGLRQEQKWISSIYFYDELGSQLFDAICELPEYYPTRTELSILEQHGGDICAAIGPEVLLVEPGSGSSVKVRHLLDRLTDPVAYVPVEISREHLLASAEALAEDYPHIEILPVCADFTANFALPTPARRARRRVLFFPGSTIGNFEPADALDLLKQMRALAGPGGGLIIGVDVRKSPQILERAYDDAAGVTARFNTNVLVRLNREMGADFDPDKFHHRAVWNDALGRIEMHLVSECAQQVHVAGETFHFRAGEYIHTENSYKYRPEEFSALAARAGFTVRQLWTDAERLFTVQYLESTDTR